MATKTANYRPKLTRKQGLKLAELAQHGTINQITAAIKVHLRRLPKRSYWHRDFLRLTVAIESGIPAFPIFTPDGNDKLPFVAFSTLPIVTCPGMGKCREFCYSLRSWRYSGAFCRQLQNTVFMRFHRRQIIRAWQALEAGSFVRLYVDGDLDSEQTAIFWWNLLRQRPDIGAYGYSKSLEIIERTAHAVPPNYTLNLSSGSRYDTDAALIGRILALPFVRERFVAVKVQSTRGAKRYNDPAYHRAVREAAEAAGYGRAFSCPGKCGSCTAKGPACGTRREDGSHLVPLTIAIGVH